MRKKKGWSKHRHGPSWWDEDHWKEWAEGSHWWSEHDGEEQGDDPPLPPWLRHRRDRKGWHKGGDVMFARFAIAFGLIMLLGCGVLAVLGAAIVMFIQSRPGPTPPMMEHPARWLFLLVGLAFGLAMILRWVGRRTAWRYTRPLSETMKAADAMAEGDLSARVPVAGSGEFRHFARSFNRMANSLETSDRHRRELLADIAHELRTPLTVIQGNLEGLRDGVYDATPEHLDLVLDETQKLGRLVEDLRLLTLAEAGQLPLDPQVLDVSQLLADVRDAFAPAADEAGIHLGVDTTDSLPPLVGDPQRLGQVLGNLVGNALRHTPPGGAVTLGADLPPGSGAPQEIRLWVRDTGEGIAAEDVPRVFDRFWRGDPARSHEAGAGTGLGLAITKSLVEAHGGRIWIESRLEEGTLVSCVLPLAASV